MSIYLTSDQAAHALGVQKATLYAYVSRGLIKSLPNKGKDQRGSRFRSADVARLAAQQAHARQPKEAARAALDWGMPVLESSLTLIENGELYYRGKALEELLPAATLEDAALLLWPCPPPAGFTGAAPRMSALWQRTAAHVSQVPATDRMLPLFALGQREIPSTFGTPEQGATAGLALLRLVVACGLGGTPSSVPLHEQCRTAWGLDARGVDLVRVALLCCVDHELNASSFTARCIAATEASMGAAIAGAIAALSGPLHGGFTDTIENLFDVLEHAHTITRGLQRVVEETGDSESLPGFGHPLYPQGDPRAVAILQRLPKNRKLAAIIKAAEELTGHKPSLDFALVAARRSLGLPRGSAFAIFAMARTAGWVAHILEQRLQGGLIRPRAHYRGPRPEREKSGDDKSTNSGRIIRFDRRPGDPAATSGHD